MSDEFNYDEKYQKSGEAAGTSEYMGDTENTESTEKVKSSAQTQNMDAQESAATYSWVNPRINREARDSGVDSEDMARHAAERVESQPQQSEPSANQHAYYHVNQNITPEPMQKKPEKQKRTHKKSSGPAMTRPMGMGKKWAVNIAMALVFGLVAGSVTYGVNYMGNKLNGDGTTPAIQNTAVASGDKNSEGVKAASTSGTGGSYNYSEVAKNAMPSMVAISTETVETVQSFFGTYSQTIPASGSGVIVGQNDQELLIATNNHVVTGATKVSVAFIDDTAVAAQIKGTDADNDLAVVAVKLEDIPAETMSEIKIATLGDSDELEIGEEVVAIGNALGYGQSVTNGIISAVDRTVSTQDEATGATSESTGLIQTNAAINPGNSGGALLNMKGELVGINEAKYSSTSVEGMGFAIPLAKAEPILQNLMSLQTRNKVDESDASYIGITGKNVSSDTNEAYGIPVGVFVDSLEESGPAETAGIKAGDIITEIDGRKVTTMDDLKGALEYYAKGEKVEVKVQRMGDGEYQEKTLTVILGAKSDMKTTTQEPSGQGQKNPFGR